MKGYEWAVVKYEVEFTVCCYEKLHKKKEKRFVMKLRREKKREGGNVDLTQIMWWIVSNYESYIKEVKKNVTESIYLKRNGVIPTQMLKLRDKQQNNSENGQHSTIKEGKLWKKNE